MGYPLIQPPELRLMGRWLVRSDCKQCLGVCSPDEEMIHDLDFLSLEMTSEDWRFEVIHDMASNKKNGSLRGKQFKSEDSWIIGVYKQDSHIDDIILQFLICFNKDGNEKYYAKIKVEMNECAFKREKSKSYEMEEIKTKFLTKWRDEFVKNGWVETRDSSRPAPHNSISVLKFENTGEEVGYAVIGAAQSIDERGWI